MTWGRADSWVWSPAVPFPLARCATSYAVDAERQRLCMFGGFDGTTVLGKDVFLMAFSKGGTRWSAGRLVRCTVIPSACLRADDPTAWPWSAVTPELGLAERFGGAACFHNGALLLFGGVNGSPKNNVFFVKVKLNQTRSQDYSVGEEPGTAAGDGAGGDASSDGAGGGTGGPSDGAGAGAGAGAGSGSLPTHEAGAEEGGAAEAGETVASETVAE